MDIQDVSEVPQFVHLMERQKQLLKMSAAYAGRLPERRESLSTLVSGYLQNRPQGHRPQQSALRWTFISEVYLPSAVPSRGLTPLSIRDLRLETHHRGKYLLLRTVTPPSKITGILTVVEDERGDGELLQLYNQDERMDPADIIPINTVCLIKEPYYKTTSGGGYAIRVDHVSDLIFPKPHDSRIPLKWRNSQAQTWSAEDWKEHGNAAVRAGNFIKARESYTAALSCPMDDQELLKIRNNRAHANLQLGRFDEALQDAEIALQLFPTDEKALFRASRALYELERFPESLSYLQRLVERYPDNTVAQKELSRTKLRVEEEKYATFDFRMMLDMVGKNIMSLDCATYVGPVAVKESKGRGRGVFLTRDVKAGELLVCEKACAVEHTSDVESGTMLLVFNINTNRITKGQQASVIAQIVNQLYRNPSKAESITSVYSGSHNTVKASEVDGEPIVDTFLVERMVSLNTFGCPRSSAKEYRAFVTGKQPEFSETSGYDSTGFWILASHFNHGCLPNASRSFIGNFMIIRAARDMASGEELTWGYVSPDLSQEERLKKLSDQWGFVCDCKQCHAERATPKEKQRKRAALLKDLKTVFAQLNSSRRTLSQSDLDKSTKVLDALEATYAFPASEQPRLALCQPFLGLARIYRKLNRPPRDVVAMATKVLSSMGFETQIVAKHLRIVRWGVLNDYVVEAFLHLEYAHGRIGNKNFRDDAAAFARKSYEILQGEPESFEEARTAAGERL